MNKLIYMTEEPELLEKEDERGKFEFYGKQGHRGH